MYSEESELTKEERGWLHLLDEELALPPLPPDFISNVLVLLGMPSLPSLLEEATEPAMADSSSETHEEFLQRLRDLPKKRNYGKGRPPRRSRRNSYMGWGRGTEQNTKRQSRGTGETGPYRSLLPDSPSDRPKKD
jgi:hypothetical protein